MAHADGKRMFYRQVGKLFALWVLMGAVFGVLSYFTGRQEVAFVAFLIPCAIGVVHCGYLGYLFYSATRESGTG